MAEGPVKTGSSISYQIIVFLIVIIWTFIGIEVAEVRLLSLFEAPLTWIGWAVFVLISLTPAITAVSWRMKARIKFIEPEWEFREREVSFSEYEEMMKQYRWEYRTFISIVDYSQILLAFIISIVAVASPFFLMRTTVFLIAASPFIFGFFVLLFGLVYSSVIFKFIPNEATPHFPLLSDRLLRPLIDLMQKISGISWVGINLTIGESSGYYTIRNVMPVSRIEGIESVSLIQGVIDESGHLSKFVSKLHLDNSDSSKLVDETSSDSSIKQLTEMVYKTLQTYIETKGADDILDEVLDEVMRSLQRFDENEKAQAS